MTTTLFIVSRIISLAPFFSSYSDPSNHFVSSSPVLNSLDDR